MSKHTPGPWHVGESRHGYDVVIRNRDGDPVALVLIGGYTKQTGSANARTIAASTELLSFAEELLNGLDARMIRIDSPGVSGIDVSPGDETLEKILARGRSAIAKVEQT